MSLEVQTFSTEGFMTVWIVVAELDDDTTGITMYDNERSARQHAEDRGGICYTAPVYDNYEGATS